MRVLVSDMFSAAGATNKISEEAIICGTHEREDDDDAPGEAHSLEIVIVDEPWKHIMSTRFRTGEAENDIGMESCAADWRRYSRIVRAPVQRSERFLTGMFYWSNKKRTTKARQ